MDIEAIETQLNSYGEQIILWAREGNFNGSFTQEWPLTQFSTAVFIVAGYLAFVLFGSVLMKATSFKINLYPFKFVYNLAQVILCSYMCVEAALIAYRNNYTLVNPPFDDENAPVAHVLWIFYVSKVFDFFDTIFIILSRKWNQLSFLHVYHHVTIFTFYWLNINAGYDGDIYLTIVLNGFIHTIMYTYYFVSMHAKDIWWKHYLTMCQMIQFTGMMGQSLYLTVSGATNYPRPIIRVYFFYILSLFLLFAKFLMDDMKRKKAAFKKKQQKSA
jgi:elongation of very long chain fatty acids protein 4